MTKFFVAFCLLVTVASATDHWVTAGSPTTFTLNSGDQLKWYPSQEYFVLHTQWQTSQYGYWYFNVGYPASSASNVDSVYHYTGMSHAITHSACVGDLDYNNYYGSGAYIAASYSSSSTVAVTVTITLLEPDSLFNSNTWTSNYYLEVPDCVNSWGAKFIGQSYNQYWHYQPDDYDLPFDKFEQIKLYNIENDYCSNEYYWREGEHESHDWQSDDIALSFEDLRVSTPSTCNLISVDINLDYSSSPYSPSGSSDGAFIVVMVLLCILFPAAIGVCYLMGDTRPAARYPGHHAGGPATYQPINAYGEAARIPSSYQPPTIATYDASHDGTPPPSYSDTMRGGAASPPRGQPAPPPPGTEDLPY